MTNIFPTDFTEKTTIDSGDFSLVADSADSFKIKKLKTDSLKSIVPWPAGNGIASITTNKVGKTTTVTITEDNSDVTTFDVEDGADGTGSGDVLASGTLTNDTIILGGGTKTVKSSSKTIVTTLGADDTSIPTSKAVKDITDGKQATMSKATWAEVDTGTDDAKYVTAKAMKDSGYLSSMADVTAASDTVAGKVELATIAETDTGTDSGRAVTPDGLAGSIHGLKEVQLKIFDDATAVSTGDGKIIFVIPESMNGMNLVKAHAMVSTVSSSGTPTVQIRNVTDSVDMLSTLITIDANEFTSYTAATAPVIDTTKDDVATADRIAIDVDVSGTGTKWLTVYLAFQTP